MHLPFDYSLAKSKNRCEYTNFQIAHFIYILAIEQIVENN